MMLGCPPGCEMKSVVEGRYVVCIMHSLSPRGLKYASACVRLHHLLALFVFSRIFFETLFFWMTRNLMHVGRVGHKGAHQFTYDLGIFGHIMYGRSSSRLFGDGYICVEVAVCLMCFGFNLPQHFVCFAGG